MAYKFCVCICMLLGVRFCPFSLIFIDLDMLIDFELLITTMFYDHYTMKPWRPKVFF